MKRGSEIHPTLAARQSVLNRDPNGGKRESATRQATRVSFTRPSLQRLSLASEAGKTDLARTNLFRSRIRNVNDDDSSLYRTRTSMISKALIDAKRKNRIKPFRFTFLRPYTLVFKNALYVSLRFQRADTRLLRL